MEPRPPQRWMFQALRLIAVLAPFALLELGLWISGWEPSPSPLTVGLERPGEPLDPFVLEGDRWVVAPALAEVFHAEPFPKDKPPGALRIFSVGDSITWGHAGNEVPAPLDAYSAQLERDLQRRDPHHRVINCGGRSFASQRVLAVLEGVLTHDPDLVIASFGSSEHLEQRTAQAWAAELELRQRWYGRSRTRLLLGTLLGRAGSGAFGLSIEQLRRRDEGLDAPRLAPICRQKPGEAQAVSARTRDHVERMVAATERAGVPLLLLTVPSHLRWPPFAGLPHGIEDRDALLTVVVESGERIAAGEPQEALDTLEPWLSSHPEVAALHFRRAQALEALGQRPQAVEAYLLARDRDACPLRGTSAHNELLRSQARDHQHVHLVDVEARMRADVPASVMGERFLDHCHPDTQDHGRMAKWIMEAVEEMGLGPEPLPEP
jgi:lysophospholipase L1-like esterase